MMQSTLMPINAPNLDPNYILGFGDVLQLQLVGQKSEIIEVSLLRDGSITLPNIGKVFLSGLSLQEATKIIKTKFEISFIGVDVFVTLLNIRDIDHESFESFLDLITLESCLEFIIFGFYKHNFEQFTHLLFIY